MQAENNKTNYLLSITSAKICSDLMKLGVYPRKTFNEIFPDIPSELNSHFIRGVFVGDGSVFLSNTSRNKKILCASFSGSHQFLIQLIKTMNLYDSSSKILYKDLRKDSDCWNIKLYNESRALPLYYYMYKNSNGLYFQRKKSIFDNYINKKVQRLQSAIQEYKILG